MAVSTVIFVSLRKYFTTVRFGNRARISSSMSVYRLSSSAKSMNDSTWDDYRNRQFRVDPDHVREIFQTFVNAGLFDKDKMFTSTKYPSQGRFIAVRAAIDNKTQTEVKNLFEEDPNLAECLYNAVLEFNRPTLARPMTSPSRPKPPAKKQNEEAK